MSTLSKKEKDLINTGRELFWKYGIKRISVEELCEKARVSKMTFYKYFSNKNELVKAIMTQVMDESMVKFDMVIDSDSHYREKAKEMLILKMEGTENISKEFMADYYSLNDPDLLEFLQTRTNQILERFMESIINAQAKGEVRKNIKPEFIIYFFNHVQTMASDEKLLAIYPNAQELIMELLNFFFHGILADDESGK